MDVDVDVDVDVVDMEGGRGFELLSIAVVNISFILQIYHSQVNFLLNIVLILIVAVNLSFQNLYM